MKTLQNYLKADPIPWLLEPTNPSVRYFTLTELLGRGPDHPEVIDAQQAIMAGETMQALLADQTPEGYWGLPDQFYHSRERGATWRLNLFAELGAQGTDPRIRNTVEFLFAHSQDPQGGGFSPHYDAPPDSDPIGIPCLTGNMVWSLIRLGTLNDNRTQRAIEWLLRYQRFDDGEIIGERPYWVGRYKADCWGNHTCMNGVIASLQALAEIPAAQRSSEIDQTLAKGVAYVLLHRVYKRSHDLEKPIAQHYRQLGFPLFHRNDFLRMLLFLSKLEIHDPRMQEAVETLVRKQNKLGQWKLQKVPDRMPIPLEKKGEPSKWITLRALTVLKHWSSPPGNSPK